MAGAQLTASMATAGSDQKKKERREGEGELVTEDEGGDDLVVPFWNKKERGAQEERKENAGEGQKYH